MMDFLKLSATDISLIDYFRNHNLLEWVKSEDRINLFDKEVIKTKTIKQYKGILFCFYSKRIDILFKPHYYFNNNLHNANDFQIADCINTILELKSTFEIDLKSLKVVNIEFGINVLSPICIKKLIAYLLYQERNEFKTVPGLAFCKMSFKSKSDGTVNKYKIFKAYAKGIQFPEFADIDTFRIEIKSRESKYVKKLGIYTANDLLNFDCYLNMSNKLLEEWKKVLLIDNVTDFSNLTTNEQAKIKEYLNSITWFDISQDPYKNKFNKERGKYYKLVDKNPNNLKNILTKIISDKLEYLKNGYISTQNDIKIKAIQNSKTSSVSTQNKIKNKAFEKNKSGYISNIYKVGNVTTTETETTIKNDEVEKPLLIYKEQKISIAEYNCLAVQNYNSRYG
ncbi:hypothetical protein [Flavobacterium sp. LB2R40]|uniref:hypothetical protein n=1 Tax=Flavobacterium sp. LB2R40 TaxID=3401722 RepID=UPI003AAC3DF5